jgi:hypothetical protein
VIFHQPSQKGGNLLSILVVNNSGKRKYIKLNRSVLWGFTASHKQQQKNRAKAQNRQGSTQQAGRTKERGEGESTETNPGRQKSKSAKQNRQQSKITQQQDN